VDEHSRKPGERGERLFMSRGKGGDRPLHMKGAGPFEPWTEIGAVVAKKRRLRLRRGIPVETRRPAGRPLPGIDFL
jgi:hypothetical protein